MTVALAAPVVAQTRTPGKQMKINKVLLSLAIMGTAIAARADLITFTFLENGSGDLGSPSHTFTESGISLTATSSGPHLFAKTGGGDENGLGLAGTDDNEITAATFIQLTVPTVPGSSLKTLSLGSVQSGELAEIFFSKTLGTLGTQIGTVSADGTFDISSLGPGYIGISGGGTGGAITMLGIARRKLTV